MKTKIFLLAIIMFTAFIRLYKISSLPPSLYYDEVDAGYQALIFNQNNSDYYGNKYPIHFHSFGDYRTSLNIYAIAISERLTHNPELSVRLPSAIFGIASVLVIYLITRSLFAGFLLAVSPWAIHYSRIGFEASGMILAILLGIYFWQKYIQKNKLKNIYLSVFFFCLSPYFYSTAKLFLIFIVFSIILVWRENINKLGIIKILSIIVFASLLMTPMVKDTISGKSGFRFSYISIFTEPHREQTTDNLRYQDVLIDHPGEIGIPTSPISMMLHNKYQLVLQKFITNYVSSFSSPFLFLQGDANARHGFAGWGLLYLIDAPLILIGIFFTFHRPKNKKLNLFFLLLLIFASVPFALTRDSDSPHATRLILMLPSIVYFAALGLKHLQPKRLFFVSTLVIYTFSFAGFWHFYYYHYPQDSAMVWNTGMKEAVIAANRYPNQPLVFSDKYISFVSFFLFYHPYLLKSADSISNHLTQFANSSFDGQVLDSKYYFGHLNWNNLSFLPKDAIIVIPKSEYNLIPQTKFAILETISKKYINQEEFFLLKLK